MKGQKKYMFISLLTFIVVVVLTAAIGFIAFGKEPEVIQGQIEVSEYRVSSKLPGRIVELRVKEGDFVRKGDTLAILEVPEIEAQRKAADAGVAASAAFNTITDKGARKEQIQGAYQLWQQAQAAQEITKKSYTRAQNLFDEGVITAQKRDEAYAAYKAAEAAVLAAKSQYDLAKNGARTEEKEITREKVKIAQSSADAAHSLQKETVQIAQYDGEISEIYPKVGELVGTGSPIMSIAILKEMWGTFNVREDQLQDLSMNSKFKVFIPAFNKEVTMQTYYLKDQGSYAAWRATKASGQYDLKTFEVKARFVDNISGVRPGMSLVIKR
jgi:hypothetical protein